jgi:hypothetical protein
MFEANEKNDRENPAAPMDNGAASQWLGMLAHLYIQQRHYAGAIVLLEAWLLLHPDEARLLQPLAVAYLHNRQYRESLVATGQLLEKLDRLNRDRWRLAPIWLIRAQAFENTGSTELAREALQQYYSWRAA